MVSPLGLSERQLLIYNALYKKCNFENMLVDMTIDQIILEIKSIELSYDIAYREVKKLIELGCLRVFRKKSKGKAPIYEIVKFQEKTSKLKQNQIQVKSKLKPSNSNDCNEDNASDIQVKSKLKPYTIKEKEKEKEINIYSRVITRLNELTCKSYKPTTKKTVACIDARLKEGFIEDDFYKVIEIKTKEWLGTNMEIYLRPETLFGTKFEGYLNQKPKDQQLYDKPMGKVIEMKIGEG